MPEKFKKRFSLKNQLLKDQMKNFQSKTVKPLTIPKFNMGLSRNDGKSSFDIAAENLGKDARENFNKFSKATSKELDAFGERMDQRADDLRKTRAINEYRSRLRDEDYRNMRDQYGVVRKDNQGQFSTRGLEIPFADSSTFSKQERQRLINKLGKKNVKNYPYLSAFAESTMDQINPMYIDPRSGSDFNNQQRRNQAAGVDYDSRAVNRYDGTTGMNAGFTELTDEGYFPVGSRFSSTISPNKPQGEFVLGSYLDGSFNAAERMAADAAQASQLASTALAEALAAEDFETAQNILSTGQANVQDLGFYAEKDAFRGTSFARRGGRNPGREKVYLQSPGSFYGTRVADNLKFRTDRAAETYKDELARLEFDNYMQRKMRELSNFTPQPIEISRPKNYLNLNNNFDERSGS